MSHDIGAPLSGFVDDNAKLLAETVSRSSETRALTETSVFVLTRAVLWTILTATIDAPHLLKRQEFEDELVLLVQSLLRAEGVSKTPARS